MANQNKTQQGIDSDSQVPEGALPASATNVIPLLEQLKPMSKEQLLALSDEKYGFKIDATLTKEVILDKIMQIDKSRRKQAQEVTMASAKAVESEEDPIVDVMFLRLDFPDADLEFSHDSERGMFGPENPKGFKKCPSYHLFPNEMCSIPWSVKEHLERKTFVIHKATFDPATGMISGSTPIVKPRFVLQLRVTKDQILQMKR